MAIPCKFLDEDAEQKEAVSGAAAPLCAKHRGGVDSRLTKACSSPAADFKVGSSGASSCYHVDTRIGNWQCKCFEIKFSSSNTESFVGGGGRGYLI